MFTHPVEHLQGLVKEPRSMLPTGTFVCFLISPAARLADEDGKILGPSCPLYSF